MSQSPHTFHIPVMGTAFSIDTPLKVAKYGISSVISLVDDTLIEEMREFYCKKFNKPYEPITKYDEDARARRITAYLNLVDDIVKQQFATIQKQPFTEGSEITTYFELLPENSQLKALYRKMLETKDPVIQEELQERLRMSMRPGDINVNIMTKLDRPNFDQKRNPLPDEFSDALAALRGYAESRLNSAIVFSAGINRRLYSYVEKFKDFFADAKGYIKKRIILKVTDYRSSIIQGKFFAKKGLWVSEYRVESGLNCGGHAFASEGFLLGPILEEFKQKKDELIENLHKIYNRALQQKGLPTVEKPHEMRITAQGGIGTAVENEFLINYYGLDATGWGSPFLLVPEATNVDDDTLQKLTSATEKDVYLSDVSPLGVPFNNLKGNFSDLEKERRAESGKPGSPCPKGHLVSNTEFTEKPICTASRQYQKLKVDQLESMNLEPAVYKQRLDAVVKKACICNDLGDAVLVKNKIFKKGRTLFPAICPGPNIAYFTKAVSLKDMVGHIYGRINIMTRQDRPNMFLKELSLYVDYFRKEVQKIELKPTDKQVAYLTEFRDNLLDGINYYMELFPKMMSQPHEYRLRALEDLETFKKNLEEFANQHCGFFKSPVGECVTA